jgi:hypothetical protein
MSKSLRDLTLTLARAKPYHNRTVLRVIPPPLAPKFPSSPQHARARLKMPARSKYAPQLLAPSTLSNCSLQVRSPIARSKYALQLLAPRIYAPQLLAGSPARSSVIPIPACAPTRTIRSQKIENSHGTGEDKTRSQENSRVR